MAIAWLTILQHVPWSEVLKNAPKVAEGAKRLWGSIAKKPVAAPAEIRVGTGPDDAMAQFEARANALEAALSETHQQLLAATELIKALSEQNAQLVEGMARIQSVLRWVILSLGILAVIAIVAMGLVLGAR